MSDTEPTDREAHLTDLNPECTCRGCRMQLERDEARATIGRVRALLDDEQTKARMIPIILVRNALEEQP